MNKKKEEFLEEMNKFLYKNLDTNMIVECKLGRIDSNGDFSKGIVIDELKKYLEKWEDKKKKYFRHTIYFYDNMQLIVDEEGNNKCYKDTIKDKTLLLKNDNGMDINVIIKERKKSSVLEFPCRMYYDRCENRELISVNIFNNLKINIYNKNNLKDGNEISIQYLHNSRNEDMNRIIGVIKKILDECV